LATHFEDLFENQEFSLAHERKSFPRLSPATGRAGGSLFAITDVIAERARKLGGTTLHSISDISSNQRLTENNEEGVRPDVMLTELCADNQQLTRALRAIHEICARQNEVATTSLIEVWIDEAERRKWFLSETLRADG
jgi:starvation-inducible DNA-binding protein